MTSITSTAQWRTRRNQMILAVLAPLIRSRLWRFINLLTYLLIVQCAVANNGRCHGNRITAHMSGTRWDATTQASS